MAPITPVPPIRTDSAGPAADALDELPIRVGGDSFYAPQFLYEFQQLLRAPNLDGRVRVSWEWDRLHLSILRPQPFDHQTEQYRIVILDPRQRALLCPMEDNLSGRLEELAVSHGLSRGGLTIEEAPFTYLEKVENSGRTRRTQYLLVQSSAPLDGAISLEELQSQVSNSHETLNGVMDRVMVAYLFSRHGYRDLGRPRHDYSDVALAQAFSRLHPNTEDAREALVRFSPIVSSPLLAQMTGALEVLIVDDSEQYTGSFKPRGASNRLMAYLLEKAEGNPDALGRIARHTAVLAASHGNHAQGVVWAANQLDFKDTLLVLPLHDQTQKNKIRKCLKMGAIVMLYGRNLFEAMERAQAIDRDGLSRYLKGSVHVPASASDEEIDALFRAGKTAILFGDPDDNAGKDQAVRDKVGGFPQKTLFVHTYDDPLVSTGQGTQVMELIAKRPHLLDSSFVYAVGAGGLGKLASDATFLTRLNRSAHVYGVNREHVSAFARSLKKRRYDVRPSEYTAPEVTTAADGVDVPLIGRQNFEQILSLDPAQVHASLVTEEEIYEAIVFAVSHPWYNGRTKQIEGAPAAVLAAAINGALGKLVGRKVGLSITGDNIDETTMARAFALRGWVAEDADFYAFVAAIRREIRNGSIGVSRRLLTSMPC